MGNIVPNAVLGGGAGALTLIEEYIADGLAASHNFAGIPATYRHLLLIVNGRTTNAVVAQTLTLQFNGDVGANYDTQYVRGIGATAGAAETIGVTSLPVVLSGANAVAGATGWGSLLIPFYARTDFRKMMTFNGGYKQSDAANNTATIQYTFGWRNTAAIASMLLATPAGNLAAGTVFDLYGIS